MTRALGLCLLLMLCPLVWAEEESPCPRQVWGETESGMKLYANCVGFYLLRERVCRIGWIQRDPVTELDIVYDIEEIPCADEELQRYLNMLVPSLAAQRDQQHEAEQESADLARYLGTTAWTLAGCCALVLVVMVVQTRYRKRQERGK